MSADVEVIKKSTQNGPSSSIALSDEYLPPTLYVLPLTERPFFPPQTQPILMDDAPWIQTMEKIGENKVPLAGLIAVQSDSTEHLSPADFYDLGTAIRVHHPMRSDGKMQFIAEGIRRFRIERWLSKKPPFHVAVSYPKTDPGSEQSDEIKAYAIAIINTLKELMPLNPLYSEELKFFLNRFGPNEPSLLTDFAASLTTSAKSELQEVLQSTALRPRMEKVLVLIKKELEVAKLQMKIHQSVEDAMNEQQRKFFLKEQLRAIQKELGIAKDDRTADIERFRKRIEALLLPEAAVKRIDEEMQKLSILETGSPEYGVTRNYLDTLTDLPWGVHSQDVLDLSRAQKILDKHHAGLDDIKQRIIEFIAIASINGEVSGSIICFVGPPGVGKTSIGRSVADALGRQFYRFSLGGMRDEAEIKGHRRTYIGAMPGKFVQALRDVKVANPVIMLDEIDKIGSSYQGDPASALLEVLDPEQNREFLDHYLDVRFDLSKVLFICTANQLDTIPSALVDRMEIIRLAGYITAEKREIARKHLWPKLLKRAGLKKNQLKIGAQSLDFVIENYARESGVRNLEKQLNRLIRIAGTAMVKGKKTPIDIDPKTVQDYLGKPVFSKEIVPGGVGVVTGLAWTPMGGASLNIEAGIVHRQRDGFKLTGQLGDVMRESAEIAHSYISAHGKALCTPVDILQKAYIHLHVPEGATPKDGPSAGITMATAILSLVRNQVIRKNLAMTGELTLTGLVLPVGGIREKLLAAKRNGIKEVILPAANQSDVDAVPEKLRRGLRCHFVNRYEEVVKLVFKGKSS